VSDQQVLREYLVALGFQVNTSQQRRVDRLLVGMDGKVLGLGKKALGAGLAVVGMVTVFSKQMERMWYSARYADTTVEKLQGVEYGARGVGIEAGKMTGTLKNFAAAIRGNPGLQGLLESMGVQVKGRTKEEVMLDFVKVLRTMPSYIAQQYAAMFGMDPETLFNVSEGLEKMKELAKEREQMNRDAGLDMNKVTEATKEYMGMWRRIIARTEVFGQTLMITALPAVQELVTETDKLLIKWTDIVKSIGDGRESMASLGKKTAEGVWGAAIGDRVTLTPEAKARLGLPAQEQLPAKHGELAYMWNKLTYRWRHNGLRAATDPAAVDATQDMEDFKSGGKGGAFPRPPWMKGPDSYAKYKGVAPSSLDPKVRSEAATLFAQLEAKYNLPPGLLDKVWSAESSRGVKMRSPKGAKGHFGFMDDTAREYGLQDPDDLAQSAHAAARKWHDLLKEFNGDIELAATAYNWGQGKMRKYGLGAMPEETKDYVEKVTGGLTVNQDTQIHVHGVTNADDAAQSVVRAQKDVNADIIRNQRARVR
jgi:soluble lytic murein transglycosylase-like protein